MWAPQWNPHSGLCRVTSRGDHRCDSHPRLPRLTAGAAILAGTALVVAAPMLVPAEAEADPLTDFLCSTGSSQYCLGRIIPPPGPYYPPPPVYYNNPETHYHYNPETRYHKHYPGPDRRNPQTLPARPRPPIMLPKPPRAQQPKLPALPKITLPEYKRVQPPRSSPGNNKPRGSTKAN